PKHCFHGEIVVVVPPEHVDTFAKDGWTKSQIRARIQEVTTRPLRDWVQDDRCAEGVPREWAKNMDLETPLPKFRSDDMITCVVAGGEAGECGAYSQGGVRAPMGWRMVTRNMGE